MDTKNLFRPAPDPTAAELSERILRSQDWLLFRREGGQAHLHASHESAALLIGDLFLHYPHLEAQVREYLRGAADPTGRPAAARGAGADGGQAGPVGDGDRLVT